MYDAWRGGPGLRDLSDEAGAIYNPRVARRALAYARPYTRPLLITLALTLIAAALNLVAPYLVKIAIDEHIAVGDLPGLTVIILITFGVYVAQFVAVSRESIIVSRVGQQVITTIRSDLFHHLERLSLGYYDRAKVGVVVSRVINDVSVMNDLLTNGLITLFGDVFTLFATIAIMLVMSPKLALLTFAVMPVMAIAVVLFSQHAKVAYRNTRHRIAAVTADFAEAISGARVVQAFSREEVSQTNFDRLNDANRRATIHANTLSSGLMPIVEFTNALAIVAVVWYGGSQVLGEEVTLGVLVAFLTYITRFFQPIRELTQFYNQLQAATAGGERVFELMDEPVTVSERPNAVSLAQVRGEVEFQNVWFAYDERPVLREINVHAAPGQMIALVGHTGAGKTTVASLLARFYDPTQGSIRLDGHDLRDLSLATLRRNVAVVLQDNFLFAGTIADNIRYGKLDATDEEVEQAGRIAHADEFIQRLPEGYQTLVMESAANLSLGQRQLIAIARAILADPRVLILDEATSSVDPRTEARLQQALQALLKGRTSFVIAHRLPTIRAADCVLVIDDGQIIERGTHDQLLAQQGAYYRLHRQQFEVAVAPSAAGTSSH
ncbi:MAG: ABC transporter ATP-binding protein [Chloroflexota bacterium]